MALCPFAVHRLIPPGANDPRITPTQAILHVDAANIEDLHDYFATRSGGVESHFHITRTGKIYQYRDTGYEADANHTANVRAISIETQGYGVGEWTPEQIASIERLLLWLRDTHGIPLRVTPAHDAPGVGFHTMWGAPGAWTPVAKSCPGPDRILQFDQVLVPWMSNPTQEDDMQLTDEIVLGPGRKVTVAQALRMAVNQSTYGNEWAKKAASAARTAASSVADLARLVGDTSMDADARNALAEDIAARTASAVEAVVADLDQLTAAEVADQLEITVKES